MKKKLATIELLSGTCHNLTSDIREVLESNPKLVEKWNALTPLMRNEWICWITIFKKDETRKDHLRRLAEQLMDGDKRPCCWPGCPHRRESAKKYFKM